MSSVLLSLLILAASSQLVAKAKMSAEQGQDDKAVGFFEQALAQDPNDAQTHYLAAVSYSRLQQLPKARKHLEDSVRLNPKNYEAFLLLGMTRDLQGETAGAVDAYKKGEAVDPSRPEAFREAGSSELLLGKSDQAVADLATAFKLSGGDVDVGIDYAYALVHSNHCQEGEKVARQSAGEDPRNASGQAILGDALACQKKDAEAIKAYTASTGLDATDAAVWTRLGLVKARSGDSRGAREALEQADKLKPGNPEVQKALANLGKPR
jgi:Flp pilus assembly protein TadD